MLEESQVDFHTDLEDEEIILPRTQGGLRDGQTDWSGKNWQGVSVPGGGDGMCKG